MYRYGLPLALPLHMNLEWRWYSKYTRSETRDIRVYPKSILHSVEFRVHSVELKVHSVELGEYSVELRVQSVELRIQSVELEIHSGFMLRYTRDKCRVEGPGGNHELLCIHFFKELCDRNKNGQPLPGAKQFQRNQFLTSANFLFLPLFWKQLRHNQFSK
jgi:hypothetical protein